MEITDNFLELILKTMEEKQSAAEAAADATTCSGNTDERSD